MAVKLGIKSPRKRVREEENKIITKNQLTKL